MIGCTVCKMGKSVHLWQPFGPDEDMLTFLRPGYHYRGFPALHICDTCKDDIIGGAHVEFEWKGKRFIVGDNMIHEVPGYVSDALLWFETTFPAKRD